MAKTRKWLLWIKRIAVVLVALLLLAVALRVASLWSLGRIGWYRGEWIELPADPQAGFHHGYRLYVPRSLLDAGGPTRLWVRPNNTSVGVSDDPEVHARDAGQLLEVSRRAAERLGVVALVPSFPRPKREWMVYTHALDRDVIEREQSDPLGRLDLQLLAMIDDAREQLEARGFASCADVLMDGYSASGMFVSRFTLIHPEHVRAAAVGAPGGWPMVPVAQVEGEGLRYPMGTADYGELFGRALPAEALRETPMLFYLGDRDTNDAVDYADAYAREDAELLEVLFGSEPVERWPRAQELFAGYEADFVLIDGADHGAGQREGERVEAFFAEHLELAACESSVLRK